MSEEMDRRERDAGLNLAGNDPMSGRRGGMDIPSMDERETDAGLNLAGNDTTRSRLAGEPKPQRDSGDQVETVEIRRSGVPSSGSIHAFQLVKGVDGAGDPALLVRKGTVNSIVAKIGATDLDIDYKQNILPMPGTGSRTYWLKLSSTGGNLDDPASTKAVEIVTTGTDPGADTVTQAKQELGSVTTNSGAITAFSSNLSGSQNVDSCGTLHSWNRV